MLVSLKNIVEPSLPSVSLNSCLHRWLRMGDQVLEMPPVWEFSLQAGRGKEMLGCSSQQLTEKCNNRKGYFSHWVKLLFSPDKNKLVGLLMISERR